ncbi:MAG: HepT-like ribonuclease domain-containing protein [Candidatus Aenigmatarchaeota archaeon]|nr:DUF86 domain-containing protein [Nanoarchaeota archaeon]
MYDKERIGKIVSDLERFFSDLEEIHIKSVNDFEDKKNFYSISMLLFSIINRTIDLGEEIVTANNLGTPSTYKDIFFLLMKSKIINRQMQKELSELTSYRNLFSYEYYAFTEKDVFTALIKVNIVKDFVKQVKRKVK